MHKTSGKPPKKEAIGYNPIFDGKRDSSTSGPATPNIGELTDETATFPTGIPQGLHTNCSPKQFARKNKPQRAFGAARPVFPLSRS